MTEFGEEFRGPFGDCADTLEEAANRLRKDTTDARSFIEAMNFAGNTALDTLRAVSAAIVDYYELPVQDDVPQRFSDIAGFIGLLGLQQELQEHALGEEQRIVSLLRGLGVKWQDIGDAIGMSKQATHYRFNRSEKARDTKISD